MPKRYEEIDNDSANDSNANCGPKTTCAVSTTTVILFISAIAAFIASDSKWSANWGNANTYIKQYPDCEVIKEHYIPARSTNIPTVTAWQFYSNSRLDGYNIYCNDTNPDCASNVCPEFYALLNESVPATFGYTLLSCIVLMLLMLAVCAIGIFFSARNNDESLSPSQQERNYKSLN